jgi:polygalacturonase
MKRKDFVLRVGTATILSFLFPPLTSCRTTSKYKGKPVTDIPFDFPDLQSPNFKNQNFNIRDYGAEPGGKKLNTEAFKKAIEACHKAGGGKVVVPAGEWLTGPIHFKSNVNLHVSEGAVIKFSQVFSDYLPVVYMQRGGFFCYNYSPFIYGKDLVDVAVTGSGTLDGQGQAWWPWKNKQPGMVRLFEMGKKGVPIEERVFGTVEDGVRPPFIQFINSKNIYLQGITVKDGPSWNVHPVFCENVIIRGISVSAHGPNNDGIDPDGCKNVLIEDCFIDVGDDNICLKSGRDEEAWRIGRPCENVVIRRCKTKAGHGGFVVGSEMSAGVKNVLVEDCDFSGTGIGLRFKSRVGRGGTVENIWARNIKMQNIHDDAIIFDLTYNGEPIEKAMNYNSRQGGLLVHAPTFKNIHLQNINCTGAKSAIKLAGLPRGENLKNITFKDVFIQSQTGISCKDVSGIAFNTVQVNQQKGPAFKITNSQDIRLANIDGAGDDKPFLELNGTLTSGIQIDLKEMQRKKHQIILNDGLELAEVTRPL